MLTKLNPPFATVGAAMRPVIRVSQFVFVQVTSLVEHFGTNRALEILLVHKHRRGTWKWNGIVI